jgi:hypothetical protein
MSGFLIKGGDLGTEKHRENDVKTEGSPSTSQGVTQTLPEVRREAPSPSQSSEGNDPDIFNLGFQLPELRP